LGRFETIPGDLNPGREDDIDIGCLPDIDARSIMNLHASAIVISSFGASAVVAVSSLDAPRGT
jgi:hypothetical protein